MTSILLQVSTRYIMGFQLALSFYFLFRGHNFPGGGFIAGLLLASSFALYAIAFGVGKARSFLYFEPEKLLGIGLSISAFSGLFSVWKQRPYLTGIWGATIFIPGVGNVSIGTPFLFDIGVCIVVFGMTVSVIFSLFERDISLEEDD